MDDALRKLAQSVQVIRKLHKPADKKPETKQEPQHIAHGGTVEPHVHPAYHIHGTHIREEIHGKPVFTGEL
jgi:hypothetical protein